MIASIREARAKLSKLVESAANGEEVILTSHGTPRAKLVALPQRGGERLDLKRIRRLARMGRTARRRGPDATEIVSEDRDDR